MTDEPTNDGGKLVVRDENGRVVSGVLNPTGKPKGTLSFSTLLDKAIREIATANSVDPESIESDLLKMALKMAREGNYQFFKDLMDRKYGQAKQKIDMGLDEDIKEIKVEIVK